MTSEMWVLEATEVLDFMSNLKKKKMQMRAFNPLNAKLVYK